MPNSLKYLKILDKILKLLYKNMHRNLTSSQIIEELNLNVVKGNIFGTSVDLLPPKSLVEFNLQSALDYLFNEGYIYNCPSGYRISYKGIIKLRTNPFKDEINKKEWGTKRERMLLIITAISLAFAFLKDLLKLFSC